MHGVTGFRPAHDVAGDPHLMESRTLVGAATKGRVIPTNVLVA